MRRLFKTAQIARSGPSCDQLLLRPTLDSHAKTKNCHNYDLLTDSFTSDVTVESASWIRSKNSEFFKLSNLEVISHLGFQDFKLCGISRILLIYYLANNNKKITKKGCTFFLKETKKMIRFLKSNEIKKKLHISNPTPHFLSIVSFLNRNAKAEPSAARRQKKKKRYGWRSRPQPWHLRRKFFVLAEKALSWRAATKVRRRRRLTSI